MDGASIQFAELKSDGLWIQADLSFGVVCPSLSLAVSVALVWGGNSGIDRQVRKNFQGWAKPEELQRALKLGTFAGARGESKRES